MLTDNQKVWLTCLADGLKLPEIAEKTGYNLTYIMNQLKKAREILGAKTNTQAVVLYDRERYDSNR